ncbi:MAG TPA: ankyrin repeat domain-containing protein [Gammaproteobacteria bacterium]|jgi:ankyrin repeat protein|nr:ankyrin repeat domain-containing protein [Gammaproteobacteria bacterium]
MLRKLRKAQEEKLSRNLKVKQGRALIRAARKGELQSLINILNACHNDLDVVNYKSESLFMFHDKCNGVTALDIAAANGHIPIVSALLKIAGVNVNNQSPYLNMNTPLLSAITHKNMKIVEALAESGKLNPNLTNETGENALTLALLICPSMVPIILKISDLNINAVNKSKYSALHYAVKHKSPRCNYVPQLLATPGIQIDLQNLKGYTPLMLAAKKGDSDSFTALLDAGADLNKKDLAGINARKIAELFRHKEIIDIIDKNERNKIEIQNQRGIKP